MGLERLENGSYRDSRDPGEVDTKAPRVSVSEDEAELLATMVKGKGVLEIGTGLGVSTKAMLETACCVDTVDPDAWVQHHVWPTLESDKCKQFENCDELPKGKKYDVVFIDGKHDEASVTEDIRTALKWASRHNGMLILHDAKHEPVHKAVTAAGLMMFMAPTAHGLGVVFL